MKEIFKTKEKINSENKLYLENQIEYHKEQIIELEEELKKYLGKISD